jgi:peptidoglycan hydrolase CwlO-like protein
MRVRLCSALFAVLVAGCATGDWNEDSIFFSRTVADQRLAAERQEVDRAQKQLDDLRTRTESLQQAIGELKESNRVRRQDLASYQRQVDQLSKRLATMRGELAREVAAGAEQAATHDALQTEIEQLDARIQEMRRQLLLLLENA